MKRILIALTAVFSLTTMSSFANEEKVNGKVLESFQSAFKQAAEVDWSVTGTLYKASFVLGGQHVAAFYDQAGEMVALTRNISPTQLPIALHHELKKAQANYWVSDLFEVANNEGTTYYVTIENGDSKIILKSTGSDWNTYQKQRKS